MAKKSRRTKAKYRSRATKPVQERSPRPPGAVPVNLQKPARLSPAAQDFTGRYQHVIPELKRIGIIGGAMILVLIILSFVLPSVLD